MLRSLPFGENGPMRQGRSGYLVNSMLTKGQNGQVPEFGSIFCRVGQMEKPHRSGALCKAGSRLDVAEFERLVGIGGQRLVGRPVAIALDAEGAAHEPNALKLGDAYCAQFRASHAEVA